MGAIEERCDLFDEQIQDLFSLYVDYRGLRDKLNEALSFMVNGCGLVQQEIQKQHIETKEKLHMRFPGLWREAQRRT